MYSVIQLIRPKHWFKNVFVLFPLLFSGALWTPNVWMSVLMSVFATACFCSWASAVYILNDISDIESDRQHPRKCKRPIASGAVSIPTAITFCVLLVFVPFAALAGLYFFREEFQKPVFYFAIVGAAYLINSILYDLLFRKQVLLDVFSIALAFVLRILGVRALFHSSSPRVSGMKLKRIRPDLPRVFSQRGKPLSNRQMTADDSCIHTVQCTEMSRIVKEIFSLHARRDNISFADDLNDLINEIQIANC
ncbi:MAG: UbiA family prenyltransferase [Thermoguttaceae bacterium]|nr:UbiA family prenyltransferase [Thermoguttaceae bacterium]